MNKPHVSPAGRAVRVNRLTDMADPEVCRDYAKLMARGRIMYGHYAGRIAKLAPHAGTILDAATGPGFLLCRLAKRYPRATIAGLDLSPVLLELAGREVESCRIGDRVRLHAGSIYDMPFRRASFDLVTNTMTLHCLDDLAGFFSEAKRVLKPGGLLVALAYRRDCFPPFYLMSKVHTAWCHLRHSALEGSAAMIEASYNRSEAEGALRSAGFRRFEVTTGLAELRVAAGV